MSAKTPSPASRQANKSLLFGSEIIVNTLVEQGVDGAGEISVGRSSQKRIDVVHTEDKLGSSIYNLWRDG